LFEQDDIFHGVYSSLKSAHRAALKIANKGPAAVYIKYEGEYMAPTLPILKKIFNGEVDIKIEYASSASRATIIKTKLKE
jgi:hypothetical protein